MASADVVVEPLLPPPPPPQRDISSNSSILSKFTRSPSRKHKARPSSEAIEVIGPAPPSKPTRVLPRPGPQRTITAPEGSTLLSTIRNDNQGSQEDNVEDKDTGEATPKLTTVMTAVSTASTGQESRIRPTTSAGNWSNGVPDVPTINGAHFVANAAHIPLSSQSTSPNAIFQHIHDMSHKRIATLNYMRKAHEGKLYWFNTIQFSKTDISRLPSYTPARLSRRATNYLLLGMSIPAVLDVHPSPHPSNTPSNNSAIAYEYLRSLLALLNEFESFQQLHPIDGSSASSLSRARIPQMFKRNPSRPRKSSGAPVSDIGLPLQPSVSAPSVPDQPPPSTSHSNNPSLDQGYNPSFNSSSTTLVQPHQQQQAAAAAAAAAPMPVQPPAAAAASFPTTSSFPSPPAPDAPNSTLLPSEYPSPYIHLLTPPLPFAPDFHTVFSALCDVLIDAYQRLLQLLSIPAICTPGLLELFNKVDGRLRKVMVGGIIREFENASREAAKREMMGVQRVVLGGLMGT